MVSQSVIDAILSNPGISESEKAIYRTYSPDTATKIVEAAYGVDTSSNYSGGKSASEAKDILEQIASYNEKSVVAANPKSIIEQIESGAISGKFSMKDLAIYGGIAILIIGFALIAFKGGKK